MFEQLKILSDLEKLILSNNRLETVDVSGFSQLCELDLYDNNLRDLSDSGIEKCVNLKFLNLSNNSDLCSLDTELLSPLTDLKLLNLQGTNLTGFEWLKSNKARLIILVDSCEYFKLKKSFTVEDPIYMRSCI